MKVKNISRLKFNCCSNDVIIASYSTAIKHCNYIKLTVNITGSVQILLPTETYTTSQRANTEDCIGECVCTC